MREESELYTRGTLWLLICSAGSLGDQSDEHDSAAPQTPRVLEDRAREILTQYLIELLSSLVLPEPLPQSIGDVNARLAEGQLCFPDKLMPTKAELEEFHALAEKGKKVLLASLDLPVDKIFAALKVSPICYLHAILFRPPLLTCPHFTSQSFVRRGNDLTMVVWRLKLMKSHFFLRFTKFISPSVLVKIAFAWFLARDFSVRQW